MKNLMAAFTLKQMYSAVTIFHWLAQNKKTIMDLENYLDNERADTVHRDYIVNPCPDCKAPMRIMPVNSMPGDQVGSNKDGVPYKSQWVCPGRMCVYAEYSIEEGNVEALKYIKKIEQGGNI